MAKKSKKTPEFPSYNKREDARRRYKEDVYLAMLNMFPSETEALKRLNKKVSKRNLAAFKDAFLENPYSYSNSDGVNIWCSCVILDVNVKHNRVIAKVAYTGRNETDAWRNTVIVTPSCYDKYVTVFDVIDSLIDDVTGQLDDVFYRIWIDTYGDQ